MDNNYVDAVIQLPPDLFFGTSIGTCILVLKRSKRDNSVLFINAAAEFVRWASKNKLLPSNQDRILEVFRARVDVDHFAKLISYEEIKANAYNIAVSSYVEAEDTSAAVDIQTLNGEIARIVARQSELREQIDTLAPMLQY